MTLTVSTRSAVIPYRSVALTGGDAPSAPSGAGPLEENSDRPEVQARIGEAIRSGKIRVLPDPDHPDRVKVRVIPPGERAGQVPRGD